MTAIPPKFTVYVTGIPRSGSTWAFNVCRLLLQRRGKVSSGKWRDPSTGTYRVVKTHRVIPTPGPCAIIHSTRHYSDAIASWNRIEPGHGFDTDALSRWDMEWRKRAHFTFHYDWLADKELLATTIAAMITVPRVTRLEILSVLRKVDGMAEPATGQDPVTLLHAGHRSAPPRARI